MEDQQLNIAFYCSSLGWGGLEMNLIRRAAWMKERGANVVLFCVDGSPVYENGKDYFLRIERVERNKKYGDRKNARTVHERCKKHNINVLWIRDARDISLAGLVKKQSKGKIKLLYQQAMQLGVNKRDFIHTRRFSRIDLWIAPLEYLAEQVRKKTKFPKEKIHVVPLGREVQDLLYQSMEQSAARVQFKLDPNITLIGVIGRIDPQKGQLFLVKVIAELRKKYPDTHLLIVGEKTRGEASRYEEEVKETIERYGLSDYVHLRPFTKKVGAFYKAVDVVAMASDAETYGMVTVEAMLFGCRIIGTNTAGTPNLLNWGEFGELYSPGSIKEFCQAYETMLVDEEQAEKKARQAKEFAKERFDHYRECQEIENLLQELLIKRE